MGAEGHGGEGWRGRGRRPLIASKIASCFERLLHYNYDYSLARKHSGKINHKDT